MVNMQTAMLFTAENATEIMLAENEGFTALPDDPYVHKLYKDAEKSGMLKDWINSESKGYNLK